jgi:putative addiction module component (TIGR02574 family)
MSVKRFFAAAKKLPFDERVELAHRLWDEFMDGFQGWKAPSIPDGTFPWKTLKAQIYSEVSRADRFALAQQVWSNVVENGYEPELTPEQIEELDRRAEDALKNPGRGIPLDEVVARIEKRFAERRK